jgi:hypothetical protein
VAVLLLSACSVEAPAQTYTIKLKSGPDAGKTVTIRDTEKGTGSTRFLNADGKLLFEEKAKSRETVYALTVLKRKKDAVDPDRYKRVYEKATETQADKTRTFSYQGRTVVFERKGSEYRVGVVGKPPLDDKDLDKFIEKANDDTPSSAAVDRAIVPTRAVAVGDRWKIDPKMLGGLPKDARLDLKASSAEGKLVKVYPKGKSQFGVIEVNFKQAVQGFGQEMKFDPPATVQTKLTIDTAIDGSSTARTEVITGKLKGKGVLLRGGMKITVELDEQMAGRTVTSEEKDDAKALEVPVVRLVGPGGDWTEFTSKEGRFSASFPGKPKESTKKGKGKITTTWEVTRDRDNIGYTIICTEDLDHDPKTDPKAILKAVANNLSKSTKKKKDITLNGFDGIEFKLEVDQDGVKLTMTLRVYVVKDRLYQVMVTSAPGAKEKVQVAKFLDSFKLHDKKEAKKDDKKDDRE